MNLGHFSRGEFFGLCISKALTGETIGFSLALLAFGFGFAFGFPFVVARISDLSSALRRDKMTLARRSVIAVDKTRLESYS